VIPDERSNARISEPRREPERRITRKLNSTSTAAARLRWSLSRSNQRLYAIARLNPAILRLGNMLVRGPDTIHESENVGNSYVEASTSLYWNDASFGHFRSCRIYCDACGDNDAGYLRPMARIAEWDRPSDMETPELSWPNVKIRLLSFGLDCPSLQAEIESLQKQLDTSMLSSYGLPTRRDFGDAELGTHGKLRIDSGAGWQTITRDFWLGESTQFLNTFDSLQSIVDNLGMPVDDYDWVERYDHSPEQLAAGHRWDWDRKPRSA